MFITETLKPVTAHHVIVEVHDTDPNPANRHVVCSCGTAVKPSGIKRHFKRR